jgi:large subunit ribosomal protein L19
MNLIQKIQAEQIKAENVKSDTIGFNIGDSVRVYFKIVEGKTERVQIYEGLVIAMKNAGIGKTFTVRKNSYGIGVERVFPLNSPRVERVEVVRAGKVRRAKLYYIRTKVGKKAKIKEYLPQKKEGAAEAKA